MTIDPLEAELRRQERGSRIAHDDARKWNWRLQLITNTVMFGVIIFTGFNAISLAIILAANGAFVGHSAYRRGKR